MATPASADSTKPHRSKQPLSEEELRKMHAYWRGKLPIRRANMTYDRSMVQFCDRGAKSVCPSGRSHTDE